MKEKIKNGEYTPPITNSWANSRTKIKLDDCIYLFRSTWEAMFWLLNPELEYEKIRILYKFGNTSHNYIVDFVDFKKRIIYEIKPLKNKNIVKNIIKEQYALAWCEENNFKYECISDSYLLDNVSKLKNILLKTPNEKILKSLKTLDSRKRKNENN